MKLKVLATDYSLGYLFLYVFMRASPFTEKLMKYSKTKYPLQKGIVDEHYVWVINYLVVLKCQLGLIINFAKSSLITKRIIL